MPGEFGNHLSEGSNSSSLEAYKCNGVLIYAQPMVNAHIYLPIVIAQSKIDGLTTKQISSGKSTAISGNGNCFMECKTS